MAYEWVPYVISAVGSLFSGKKAKKGRGGLALPGYVDLVRDFSRQIEPFDVVTPLGSLTYSTDETPLLDLAKIPPYLHPYLGQAATAGASRKTLTYRPGETAQQYIGMLTGETAQRRLSDLLPLSGAGSMPEGVLRIMRELARPEEERRQAQLESRLFGQGRLGTTGGALEMREFEEAARRADLERIMASFGLREQLLSGELGRFQLGLGLMQPTQAMLEASLGPMRALAAYYTGALGGLSAFGPNPQAAGLEAKYITNIASAIGGLFD